MAISLQHACEQCGSLANALASQTAQEDGSDPLSTVTLKKLKELQAGLKTVGSTLDAEGHLFSSTVDLSDFETAKLNDVAADIREASRKLSIVLAAGSNSFQASAQSDVQTLESLQTYFDPSVTRALSLNELIPLLKPSGGNAKCAHQYPLTSCPYGCNHSRCCHGYSRACCPHGCSGQQGNVYSITLSSTFAQDATAAQTLKKLAKHLSEMAEHCEKECKNRETSSAEKDEKSKTFALMQQEVKALVPKLREHVLRVGLGKGKHLNISSGCGNVSTITNMFDYATVENAHRQLEDGRDRILQELTLRKLEAKMSMQTPEKCAAKRRKVSEC